MNELTTERRDDLLVARLAGEIDMANAERIASGILAAAGDAARVALVTEDVTYFDSQGLRMLDGLFGAFQAGGIAMRVVAPDPSPVRFLLKLCAWRPELLAASLADV